MQFHPTCFTGFCFFTSQPSFSVFFSETEVMESSHVDLEFSCVGHERKQLPYLPKTQVCFILWQNLFTKFVQLGLKTILSKLCL